MDADQHSSVKRYPELNPRDIALLSRKSLTYRSIVDDDRLFFWREAKFFPVFPCRAEFREVCYSRATRSPHLQS